MRPATHDQAHDQACADLSAALGFQVPTDGVPFQPGMNAKDLPGLIAAARAEIVQAHAEGRPVRCIRQEKT